MEGRPIETEEEVFKSYNWSRKSAKMFLDEDYPGLGEAISKASYKDMDVLHYDLGVSEEDFDRVVVAVNCLVALGYRVGIGWPSTGAERPTFTLIIHWRKA